MLSRLRRRWFAFIAPWMLHGLEIALSDARTDRAVAARRLDAACALSNDLMIAQLTAISEYQADRVAAWEAKAAWWSRYVETKEERRK